MAPPLDDPKMRPGTELLLKAILSQLPDPPPNIESDDADDISEVASEDLVDGVHMVRSFTLASHTGTKSTDNPAPRRRMFR